MSAVKRSAFEVAVPAAASATPPHVGVLLERARRRLYARVAQRTDAAGFSDLRTGHVVVFGFLPPEGTRLTTLARRAQMTKQSMGEVVRELERLGYLRRLPDPSDRRAKIIAFTDRGRAAFKAGMAAVRDVEEEWTERIGQARAAELRRILEAVTEEPA